jgi:hypothetical protein
VQRAALSKFVHRHTGDHPSPYNKELPLQFKDDQDWLSHTVFRTNKNGTLNARVIGCESSPTWPNNPELRKS